MNKLTIFTPTYNRGYIIKNLYESLLGQTSYNFEWLVIDDGSTDETRKLFSEILSSEQYFPIRYIYQKNQGKQRAINEAVKIITTEYTFIVDSDDQLTGNAVEKITKWINDSEIDGSFAGVSGVRGNLNGIALNGDPTFEGEYIDCTNLERCKFNLNADMAEVYKTDILRKYPFQVWKNETFVPEAVVWDAIALDGYKIRWYKDVIYLCEYLADGLTRNSWKLLRDNPMGYARLYDHNAFLAKNKMGKIKNTIQMDSCLFLANNIKYVDKCHHKTLGLLCLPIGYLLSIRRNKQFKKYIL